MSGGDLDPGLAPAGSERQHSVRVQRTAAFVEELRVLLAGWRWSGSDANGAAAAIRVLKDEAYATAIAFDDADTGTSHSFGHDAPFVHCLEAMLQTVPADGSETMALLSDASAASVRRQRVLRGLTSITSCDTSTRTRSSRRRTSSEPLAGF